MIHFSMRILLAIIIHQPSKLCDIFDVREITIKKDKRNVIIFIELYEIMIELDFPHSRMLINYNL